MEKKATKIETVFVILNIFNEIMQHFFSGFFLLVGIIAVFFGLLGIIMRIETAMSFAVLFLGFACVYISHSIKKHSP